MSSEITFIESGFPLKEGEFEKTVEFWKQKGVFLLLPQIEIPREKDFLCSLKKEVRVAEVEAAFSSKNSSKLVWSLRGGYGMQEVIPYLKNIDSQKIYMGFSDGTSLHYYLNQNLNLPSLHCPHPNSFARGLNGKKVLECMLEFLQSPLEYRPSFKDLKCFNRSETQEIKGKTVGGNLTTLVSLLGTPFDKGARDSILFLEEVEEPAYKVLRLLNHLEQSHFLEGVRALIFGHMSHSFENEEKKILKVMETWSLKQPFPVFYGMEAGHRHTQNFPFWLGKESVLQLQGAEVLFYNNAS